MSYGSASSSSVRLLPDAAVSEIFTNTAAYAVIVSWLGGYVSLVQASGSGHLAAVSCETLWPSVFGVACLGDST